MAIVDVFKMLKNVNTKNAVGVVTLVVVLGGALVGSIDYLDSNYASAESTQIMQQSISNLEKQFELSLIRREIADCKKEMREYRKEFGFKMERATQFDVENYKKLKDKLLDLQLSYSDIKND